LLGGEVAILARHPDALAGVSALLWPELKVLTSSTAPPPYSSGSPAAAPRSAPVAVTAPAVRSARARKR
jgi:hypothetical protein